MKDILQTYQEKKQLERLIKATTVAIETDKELLRILGGLSATRIFSDERDIPRLSYNSAEQIIKHMAQEKKELDEYNQRYAEIINEWKSLLPYERDNAEAFELAHRDLIKAKLEAELNSQGGEQ